MQAEGSPEGAGERAPLNAPPPGVPGRSTAASPDLPELQELHLGLLKRFDALDPGSKRSEAQVMRETVKAAGEWIELPVDRDTAQGIIDYWTSAIAAMPDEVFPELLQLAPFASANLTRLLQLADAVLADLREAGAEDAARLVMLSLTPEIARTGGLVFSEEERTALGSQAATEVRERLAAEGLIRRIAGGEGNPDHVLRHEALLRHWPQFNVWLTGTLSEGAKLKAAVAQAENWEYFKRARAYLLRGRALRDALPYRSRNESVAALIDASLRARWQKRTSAAVGVLSVIAAIGGMYAAGKYISKGDLDAARQQGEDFGREVLSAQSAGEVRDEPAPKATEGSSEAQGELFMWIGNAGMPLLLDLKGQPVDPKLVRPHSRYRAWTDIWLRSGLPSTPDYVSAPEVDVLPDGALMETTSAVQSYERPSGTQYWVGARRIATVYIHYSGAERARARRLGAGMKSDTFDVPEVQAKRTGAGQYEIRYAVPEDAVLAQQVADRLLTIAPPGRSARPRCLQIESKGARPGNFEIWIDLGAVRTGEAPAPVGKRQVVCGSDAPTRGLRAAAS